MSDIVMKHTNIHVWESAVPPIQKATRQFQTAKPIIIPKGTKVVFVNKMHQSVVNMAQAVVGVGKDAHFDWLMYFDDALETGLIEEVGNEQL